MSLVYKDLEIDIDYDFCAYGSYRTLHEETVGTENNMAAPAKFIEYCLILCYKHVHVSAARYVDIQKWLKEKEAETFDWEAVPLNVWEVD